MLTRRSAVLGAAVMAGISTARAQAAPVLRIGVLNDQTGPYRENGGPGSVVCARQAVKEMAEKLGLKVDVVAANHQNKADIGATIARKWFDEDGVDAIVDIQNSAIALAIADIAREKDKIVMPCAGVSDLTGKRCTPNTVHWCYDTSMLSRVLGDALVKNGGDSWFFITADYAFGHSLEGETAARVQAAGGKVVGNIRMPFPTADFSSALVRAQASGAKIIALANAGSDTINAIKQGAEFGVTRNGARVAALLIQISDVHAIGLQAAQGLALTETFYWDLNDGTRAFSSRVREALSNKAPTAPQAASYAAALHYMKAAAALGAAAAKKSGREVVARMKAMAVEDEAFGKSSIRADGRVLHTAYLFQIKSPAESKHDWDYYRTLATVPGEQAFRPMSEGGCPLVQ
ncbi:MAG: ABC transporter substrate-binding protein [Proteobacteria bacterium]|nr:ABC transporter substrate-binding protein [Pseudomonadota bacterium]